MNFRIGNGIDVHPFQRDRKLILCGEEINFELGLGGHSDADVATHAIIDSLLGAASLGDIGKHFPDTSNEFKNISSMILLKKVNELIRKKEFEIINIDLTIIAQKPKINQYIEKMRMNISKILEIDRERISIKATTTEGLGFIGRKEGIAAFSTSLLLKKNG